MNSNKWRVPRGTGGTWNALELVEQVERGRKKGASWNAFHQEEDASWNARLLSAYNVGQRCDCCDVQGATVARSTKRARDMSFLRDASRKATGNEV